MSKFLKLLDETYDKVELENPEYEGLTPAQVHAVKNFLHNGKCSIFGKDKDKVDLQFSHEGDSGHVWVHPDGTVQIHREVDAKISPESKELKPETNEYSGKETDEDDETDGSSSIPIVGGSDQNGLSEKDVDLIAKLSGGQARKSGIFSQDPVKKIQKTYGNILSTISKKADDTLKSIQN